MLSAYLLDPRPFVVSFVVSFIVFAMETRHAMSLRRQVVPSGFDYVVPERNRRAQPPVPSVSQSLKSIRPFSHSLHDHHHICRLHQVGLHYFICKETGFSDPETIFVETHPHIR